MATEEIKDILTTIDGTITGFVDGLPDAQKRIFDRVMTLVKQLDTDIQGNIRNNVQNIRILNQLQSAINDVVLTDDYRGRIKKFVESFDDIAKLQNQYLSTVFDTFTPTPVLAELTQASMDITADALGDAGLSNDLSNEIKDVLKQNILSGAKFGDLAKQLETAIQGNDQIDGALVRYAKTYAIDSVNTFNAAYNRQVTQDIGNEWFRYVGTNKDTTRPFCDALTQKDKGYFHISEIPGFLDGRVGNDEVPIYEKTGLPEGMKDGTNTASFFTNRGGWNCNHQIFPVSRISVPPDLLAKHPGKKQPTQQQAPAPQPAPLPPPPVRTPTPVRQPAPVQQQAPVQQPKQVQPQTLNLTKDQVINNLKSFFNTNNDLSDNVNESSKGKTVLFAGQTFDNGAQSVAEHIISKDSTFYPTNGKVITGLKENVTGKIEKNVKKLKNNGFVDFEKSLEKGEPVFSKPDFLNSLSPEKRQQAIEDAKTYIANVTNYEKTAKGIEEVQNYLESLPFFASTKIQNLVKGNLTGQMEKMPVKVKKMHPAYGGEFGSGLTGSQSYSGGIKINSLLVEEPNPTTVISKTSRLADVDKYIDVYAHEYGHFFDFAMGSHGTSPKELKYGLVNDKMTRMVEATYSNPLFAKLLKTIQESPEIKHIKNSIDNPPDGLGKWKRDTINHYKYLATDHEMFARAFSQYILKKVTDSGKIERYFIEKQYQRHKMDHGIEPQWKQQSFEPIEKEFDELFKNIEELTKINES